MLLVLWQCRDSAKAQDSTFVQQESFDWISGSISLNENYDDNIMEYSDAEIAQFNRGVQPAKYILSNTSDRVTSLKSRLTISPDLFSRKFRTLFRARFNRYWNRTNSFRTYTTWGVELKQYFWQKNYLSIQSLYLPKFYLRNLYYKRYRQPTRLPSRYVAEELSKRSYMVEIGRHVTSKLLLSLNYKREYSTYNDEFKERNNTANEYGIESEYRFSRWVRGSVDVSFAELWANGRDMFDDPVYDSLADISSRMYGLVLSGTVNLKPIIGAALEVQPAVKYEYQEYRSGKPTDIFHFGRIDRYIKLSTQLRYSFFSPIEWSVQYSWEENRTNLSDPGDAGSFQDNQIGIGVEYSF
jgi:hypothetical protein